MASLTLCLLAFANKILGKSQVNYIHTLSIPFPRVFHTYLDPKCLENYEEIFVIGDVHGCFDELNLLLEKANATSDKVLKIFVGDLVNKGPKNSEVLNLVKNSKSMLSVRGNHDEIIIKEFIAAQKNESRPQYNWVRNLTNDDINYLQEMPYTISLPSLNSVVVHAGLVPGLPLEGNDPYNMVQMRNIIENDPFWDGGMQVSKLTAEGEPWASLWNGPQHVYFGHDARRMLQIYPLATGLDTGCVYGNFMTGVFIHGPRKGTFVDVKALKIHSPLKGD